MFGRRCPFGVGACLLLVLLQVLAAPVHAANMARHTNGSLGYVFCGELSPAQQAALSTALPPEVRDALEQEAERSRLAASSCNLCNALHASAFALPVSYSPALLSGRHHYAGTLPTRSLFDARRPQPSSRGPPARRVTV